MLSVTLISSETVSSALSSLFIPSGLSASPMVAASVVALASTVCFTVLPISALPWVILSDQSYLSVIALLISSGVIPFMLISLSVSESGSISDRSIAAFIVIISSLKVSVCSVGSRTALPPPLPENFMTRKMTMARRITAPPIINGSGSLRFLLLDLLFVVLLTLE